MLQELENQSSRSIPDARQRRRILIATCTALMAVVASASGLNVAQQDLANAFAASQSTVLWFINVYIVALAATLMPVGAVGDRWGRRPVLIVGLVLFALASAGGAVAPSGEFMLATRALAGLAAAMIMPVTLSVITSTFPASERSQAIGVWSGVAGAGGLLGMFVSAAVIDLANWRWLFALPVALAAAALLMALRSVPNSRETKVHPFDIGGSIFSMFAVGGLVFAIHEVPTRGWDDALTVTVLLVGMLATAGFIWWELRHPSPLLDIRLFADRRLAAGSIALLFVFGVIAGIFILLFPYFQVVLGWSALRSTLGLLPMALMMMVTSGLAPKLSKRSGMRSAMLTGLALAGVGLAVMATLVSVDGGYVSVLPGMLVIGVGMGLTMPPSTEAITVALPPERQGVASALNDVTREFGSALGVALLGAVLSAGYRGSMAPHLKTVPAEVADAAAGGIATAMRVAHQLGSQAEAFARVSKQAFVDGWAQSMWISVGVIGALFTYVLVRGPRGSDQELRALLRGKS
jgi:EmrB/QacA subfamily drug resistance transporter